MKSLQEQARLFFILPRSFQEGDDSVWQAKLFSRTNRNDSLRVNRPPLETSTPNLSIMIWTNASRTISIASRIEREGRPMTAFSTHPSNQPEPVEGRVVGIDPGLLTTGYAVLEPSTAEGLGILGPPPIVLEAGVIRARKLGTLQDRLDLIYQGILEVLNAYPPAALALEQVHSRVKHPRTAILMAHARGAIMLAAAHRGVPVIGYAASRIKKTLTGHGRATKIQMQEAIRTELRLDRLPEPHDVADACAVAICHFQVIRLGGGMLGS